MIEVCREVEPGHEVQLYISVGINSSRIYRHSFAYQLCFPTAGSIVQTMTKIGIPLKYCFKVPAASSQKLAQGSIEVEDNSARVRVGEKSPLGINGRVASNE